MALLQCNFFSSCLNRTVPIQVVLPTDKRVFGPGGAPALQAEKPFKTLYLLHGLFGNYSDWVSGTRVQAWAQDHDLAVVCPSGDNSFYVDNVKAGNLYSTFIGQELVEFTRRTFPLSRQREDTFIGGLSMGGYGATINGLRFTDTFSHVVALSSAYVLESNFLSAAEYTDNIFTNKGYGESIFNDLSTVKGGPWDYNALAEKTAQVPHKPKFYMACGTEDGLIGSNREYRDLLLSLGYEVAWHEGPGGHDWVFWDKHIGECMDWLPLGGPVEGLGSGHIGE